MLGIDVATRLFFEKLGQVSQADLAGVAAEAWLPRATQAISKDSLEVAARKAVNATEPDLPSLSSKQITGILYNLRLLP